MTTQNAQLKNIGIETGPNKRVSVKMTNTAGGNIVLNLTSDYAANFGMMLLQASFKADFAEYVKNALKAMDQEFTGNEQAEPEKPQTSPVE